MKTDFFFRIIVLTVFIYAIIASIGGIIGSRYSAVFVTKLSEKNLIL